MLKLTSSILPKDERVMRATVRYYVLKFTTRKVRVIPVNVLLTYLLRNFIFRGYRQRRKQSTRCNKFCLLIFLNQLYMCRATNSPIIRSTFWLYTQLLVQCTDIAAGRQQYRCIAPKAVYTVKKCSWWWASLSPGTCRADLKRSINKICCILLVVYIVVLMMQGLTNIKFEDIIHLQKVTFDCSFQQDIYKNVKVKVKVKHPVTGLEWPRGFQEVKAPRFLDNGTEWW